MGYQEKVEELLKQYWEALRLSALTAANDDKDKADELLQRVRVRSFHAGAELLRHPNARKWLETTLGRMAS